MIRARNKPDGLPFRVYERHGARVYSIGYKMRSGVWAFRYHCPVDDLAQIRALRRQAIEESARVIEDRPPSGFSALLDAWFAWQDALPSNDARKRAASTLAENRREAENLRKAWGHFEVHEITRAMGYAYLDACLTATDEHGRPRPRPEKGNKEMALARIVLEFAVRKELIDSNPLDRLTKNKTIRERRYVSDADMALAIEVGRAHGGARHIVALALRTAWLCVRRPVEVRALTRDAIKDAGIVWRDGKDPRKPPVLIEWSDELRATVAEALAIQRNDIAGTMFVFGNMRGQRYTKGGWKSMLDDLMVSCEKVAAQRHMPFQRFSLQDCRPKAVSDKLDKGHKDTQDATGHTSGAMIASVYDRRQIKKAKPVA